MDPELLSKVMSELGKKGGPARAKSLSAEKRRAIALMAGKAAAKVHKKKARERKKAKDKKA
jgi:hypothetical protein